MNRKRKKEQTPEDTRRQLLQAGLEIFSEVGFEAATTRSISARAGVNLALVNYHFGDKLGLYRQVMLGCRASLEGIREALNAVSSPEETLRRVIRIRLANAFERDPMGQLFRLLCHELAMPTEVFKEVFETVAMPLYRRARELVGSILGLPADHEETLLCTRSVAGQLLLYVMTAPVLARLYPEGPDWSQQVDLIADHIYRLSSAYLRESARNHAPGERGSAAGSSA